MISLRFVKNLVAVLAAAWLAIGASAASAGTPTLTFDRGWIGEYTSAINGPSNMYALDDGTPDLNIQSVTITQNSSSNFFELQGNDIPVFVTVRFVGGSTITTTGGVNWRVTSGTTIEAIGLRVDQALADGYPLTPGSQKTYLLRAPSSTLTIANGGSINGNAALSGVLDSLNALLGAAAPVITGPTGGPGAANSAISVNENQTGVTQLVADKPVTWSITGGADAAKFQIAANGTITFLTAPDFENPTDSDGNNTYVLTVTATDSNGNTSTQTVTVTVLNLDDTPPVITGPTGGAGAAASAISVNENQTGVTQMSANEAVTWSITGGTDAAKFQIAANGTITFLTAPDFENPTDSDANNTYVLIVTATDAAGNTSTQTVTVTVLDLNDTPPVITGPNGGPGAATSTISVNENQTAVTRLVADKSVTWSITGGNDNGRFQIAADGTITFVAAPDFENPVDSDGNNTYVLTVTATDANGNTSTQTITVTVLNVDDTAPAITGPGGAPGAASSAISVNENQTAVTQLSANEGVTWTITGGSDAAKFQIAANGTITFRTAPDFENPTDSDTNNTYVLIVTATDAAGNTSTQTITVTVLDVDDTGPVITGPTGGPGAANSAISVNENQAAVTQLSANEGVTWTITGGSDAAKFQIAANGTITFRTAPDFENPTDSDGNNTYVLIVTATDAAGNTSTQTVTVTVLNLDDTPPVITGPTGGPGAAASAVSVNENQTGATQLSANESVTWSITGGSDAAKFQIAANGTVTFRAAPDFENPTDTDRNNTYVLIVTATDAAGNASTQTVTVTVLDLDDTAPLITGPSGGAGAAESAITINEGLTAVTTFTANEAVTWSLDGGADAARFFINPATGALTFITAPDFENPTDADRNNTYIVRIRAVDAAGNVSIQTLTVTIVNVDEIGRKLGQIGGKLRTGLRTYATQSLSDMLSFNEGLMRDVSGDSCVDPSRNRDVSGTMNADETQASLDLKAEQRLTKCGGKFQILGDVGLSYSRMEGNWNARLFGALRAETRIGDDVVIGAGIMASRSDDTIVGFDKSNISDNSLQGSLYGRYRITDKLRAGVFGGYGKANYDFGLTETDGFVLNGDMTGKRHMYGGMLSGDFSFAGTVITTDAVISRAVEKLGDATLSAQYLGENRSGIAFNVGTVDVTRISVPVSAPITLSGGDGLGQWTRVLLSPGLLCEDNNVASSALTCGYQLAGKLIVSNVGKSRFYGDFRYESVDSVRRSLMGVGYSVRFGPKDLIELTLEANHGVSERMGADSRAMLSLKVVP